MRGARSARRWYAPGFVKLEPGDTFDRYTIEVLLGEGGMGQVYRAYDAKLHRRVALKVLGAATGDGSDAGSQGAARLLREARAAAALDHANAVAIFDVGEHDGSPYIAMELVAGKSLRAYVGDESVSVEHRVRWLRDVARALAAAHRRGLVHRDIKPENVMVRDDDTVKVLDFGIARKILLTDPTGATEVAGAEPITRDGAVVGTLLYMAPEQMRGETLDARADQFSWAVLAYELLTGRVPWKGDTNSYRVVAQILTEDAEPPSSSANVPADVERVVMRALSKAPANRFASMDEIVAAIDPARDTPLRPSAPVAAQVSGPTASTATSMSRPETHATLASAPRGFSGRARALAALGALVVVGSLAMFALRGRGARAVVVGRAPTTASGWARSRATAPTAVTDFPPPKTASAEAASAYVAAMQAVRDASFMSAAKNFDRAARLDPSMAAAHLRIDLYGGALVEAEGAKHLQRAIELRSVLSERDQALLDAMSPMALKQPPDLAESARRLAVLLARSPGDLELQWLAIDVETDRRKAPAAYAHLLDLDPKFAAAAWQKAVAESELGDLDTALASLGRCLAISPSAASCLRVRAMIHQTRGDCAAMEADSRRMVAVESDGYKAYDFLARALLARGYAVDAVRAALAQKWAATPERTREQARLADETNLALYQGDFTSAEADATELERVVAGASLEREHAVPARLLVDIETETGHLDQAARIASTFLGTRGAWQTSYTNAAEDARPFFIATATRGGLRTAEERQQERDVWLEEWHAGSTPSDDDVWLGGFAIPAATEEDAREALIKMPAAATELRIHVSLDDVGLGAVGKTMLLAGRVDEAVPLLEAAVASCGALRSPVDYTIALHMLGLAREAKKDTRGACSAFKRVLERWGRARPRSVTAERARDHARALGCSP